MANHSNRQPHNPQQFIEKLRSLSHPVFSAVTPIQLLGSGSFGDVFLCRDATRDNELIVVKYVVKIDARTAQEARILRNLCHANICRYLDHHLDTRDERNPSLFISMEFCNGGDLRSAIRKRRATHGFGWPEPVIRRWFAQLCSALRYCHVQHVLHRDLKAENLLFHNNALKLVDFGFARVTSSTTEFIRSRLGTPHYLPPEMFEHSPYNNRVDMWCAGVLLFEMMTLTRPFIGASIAEISEAVRFESPPSLRDASNNAYSEELYCLCDALLSKSPMQRPSSLSVLQRPWAADAAGLTHAMLATEGTQVLRESESWKKVLVHAMLVDSTMLELDPSPHDQVAVNLRAAPNRMAPVLREILPGDYIEEIRRLRDMSTQQVWIQVAGGGFCVAETYPRDLPPKQVFREVSSWRVVRPGDRHRGPRGASTGAPDESDSSMTVLSPTLAATGGAQEEASQVEVLAAAALDESYTVAHDRGTITVNVDHLHHFLARQDIPADLTELLLREYADTTTPQDDMQWTLAACKLLRRFSGRGIPCVRIIRAIARQAIRSPPLAAPSAAAVPLGVRLPLTRGARGTATASASGSQRQAAVVVAGEAGFIDQATVPAASQSQQANGTPIASPSHVSSEVHRPPAVPTVDSPSP